ncbi:MAG: YicC/YloC family endoribonuclease [Eubacterium sp.]|nr:YicC/YloC family endoribonuclease [Eubacterium sp.]
MKSMTGFGRQDYRDAEMELSIEIKTVNHRFRDFAMKLPRPLSALEENFRKTISETIARGRIEIFVKYGELGAQNRRVVLNKDLAREYLEVLNEIKSLDSMIRDDIDLGLVAKFPDVVVVEEETADAEALWQRVEPVLKAVLAQIDDSRLREGEALKTDVQGRCAVIETAVAAIEAQSPEALKKHQQALRQRIEELVGSPEVDEKRLLTEVAVMADKLTIDEELTRLKSHTARMEDMLQETGEPVGRKLDFLVQEMNREINTIGSKANDIAIANLVVDVKGEIEKIREQIQNIE